MTEESPITAATPASLCQEGQSSRRLVAVWNSLLCGNFIINETKQQKDSGSLYYFFVCNLLDEVLTVINHCLSLATSVVITVLGFNKSLCYLNSLLIYLVIHSSIYFLIYLFTGYLTL